MWPLTLAAQRAAAHVLGQHGPVALQFPDNALVDGDVIPAAADTAAEIHLHRAAFGSSCAPFCIGTVRVALGRHDFRSRGGNKKAREVSDIPIDSANNHVLVRTGSGISSRPQRHLRFGARPR